MNANPQWHVRIRIIGGASYCHAFPTFDRAFRYAVGVKGSTNRINITRSRGRLS